MNYTPYAFTIATLVILNFLVYWVIFIEESRPDLSVYYLEVGQADATLIEAQNGNRILIDVGGGRATADAVINLLPFYDRNIDVVIITHPHSDHMDGLVPLLEQVSVGVVLDSGSGHRTGVVEEYLIALEGYGVKKVYARRGMVINLSEVAKAFILFPDRNTALLDPDNASIWVQVKHRDNAFLFTGDSFVAVERYMVDLDGERLESDVFQAGHHGSRTSNSAELLKMIAPDYVIISAGENNRYGHPHDEVMEVFLSTGAEVLKTFEEGNMVFISDQGGIERVK